MADLTINLIVSVHSKFEQSAVDLRNSLVDKLDNFGLRYLHVGAGAKAAYVVLPSDAYLPKLRKIAVSCRAIVSEIGYLKLERGELSEERIGSVEQALIERPIDYDIPLGGARNQLFGVCDECGGVGRHFIPPCTRLS
ncbi:hypothetical protein [Halomonas sp. H5]|uniref:hypothetical protein n=1 Tax=Halomonas sp. H5 TaxID=3423910 RepID=UPI003D36AED0